MKKKLIYFILLLTVFIACEDIYTPEIEKQESVIVVDARLVYGKNDNIISLYKSITFTDPEINYSTLDGAQVSVFDNNNTEYQLPEEKNGIFKVNFPLNPELEYKIEINYGGNTYESIYEKVPEVPQIDTIYGLSEIKVLEEGGQNNVNDFRAVSGVQLYVDINNESDLQNYRFTARKTYQYTYSVEIMEMGELVEVTMYAWKTMFPQEPFNIAAPPEYSASIDIKKHPLFFIEKQAGVVSGQLFAGWIIYLHQFSLSKSSYNFYKDLNSQLDADGRLFDPLYVQAKNNLKCVNKPEQIILGNFEISTHVERRYFIKFVSDEKGYLIKPIPYFYDIPLEGEQLQIVPEFWEGTSKIYPND